MILVKHCPTPRPETSERSRVESSLMGEREFTSAQPAPRAEPPIRGPRRPGVASFTEGSVVGHLVRLTGFMVMGMLSMNIAQLAEAVYLGIVGTRELAAVAFSMPITWGLMGLVRGLQIGASSVIARSMGSGDRSTVARLATHCELLVLIIAAVFMLLLGTYAEPLFMLLGADDDVRPLATAYTHIWLVGLIPFTLSMVGSGLLPDTGRVASPGVIQATGSVLQMAFGPFLIFGWLGFPALGVEGAAWSYVAARSITFFATFYYLVIRDRLIILSLDNVWQSWRDILHVGLPAMAASLIMPVSMLVITRLLAEYGAGVVAGYGVAGRVDHMLTMIIMSLASSIAPFVGQNWGAKRYDRVHQALRIAYGFSLAWGLLSFVLMALLGGPIVALINQDPAVVEPASLYLLIVPFSIAFMGLMQVSSSTFNALGKPVPPLVISTLRTVVIYIPLAIVGSWLFGYVGIFWATSGTSVVLGIVAWAWCRRTVRNEIVVREGALAAAD